MKLIKKLKLCLYVCLCFCFVSASTKKQTQKCKPLSLTSVHVVDRNGFAETVSSKDRINEYQNIDFLKPQPYQKVLLVYQKDSQGRVRSVAISYYENGNPKQFLEIISGRANGIYSEWHENGSPRLAAYVIGGSPDLTMTAEKSWIFDGICSYWSDSGLLLAEISYDQGVLSGPSTYYHCNGQISKIVPYDKNEICGKVELFEKNGNLKAEINFVRGKKEGKSTKYWDVNLLASEETYCQGALTEGIYYDADGTVVSEVVDGCGLKTIFENCNIKEKQSIENGYINGEVKVYDKQQRLIRLYHVCNKLKDGTETLFYPTQTLGKLQPKLEFKWDMGKVQGVVKTWYPNGNMESQREMHNNKKNGLLTAWYSDGNIMLIEEYDNNKLVRGEYYKRGERVAVSQVDKGRGLATIYDKNDKNHRKICKNHQNP